ncbi:uncharacterized protein TNCV_4382251 [Trichonephila clavipes]|nr:uncharacterized protein TNCV_4382251 [Trichonephila clavipes]
MSVDEIASMHSRYKALRANYKKSIIDTKNKAWEYFCSTNSNNFGFTFKAAFGKLSSPTNLHQISTGDPASLFHSKVSLLDSHFPSGSSSIPLVFNDCSPPSCLSPSEVEVVFRKLRGGKAPGCPQGSVLSPTLWNIYFNPILSLNSELFLLQAFADDLAVVSLAFHMSLSSMPWFSREHDLLRNPIFKIGSNSIHISKSYKYLGVNIDNRLSWTPHINSIKDKILWISSNFYRVSKNFNHQHISLMKLWYSSVVQPIISYGAGVWGGSLTSIQVQKLKSIQRIYLLKITKAYKTSPTDALNILSGIPPIHIVIRSLYFKFQLWNNMNDLLPGLIPATKLDSFISLHQILPDFLSFPINTFEGPSEWEMYTDGSKIDSNVGFAAEFSAIGLSVCWAVHHNTKIHIYTDSLSSILFLNNLTNKSSYLNSIKFKLFQFRSYYNLYWVKAHNNNLYNDYADFYAKQAVYDGEVFSVPAPHSFLSSSLNKFILESFGPPLGMIAILD